MAVDYRVTRAQLAGNRFADESPQQIARHREIERRHRRCREDGKSFLPRLRVAELQRIFVTYYGGRRLPDDDAGRADLRLMADHLAQIDPRLIRTWAAQWMPTFAGPELDMLIARVGIGRRWKADALARELRLDDSTRTRLKIRTIGAVDCSKSKRMTRRRRKRIAADRARRAKAGARPHTQSAAATQPWIDEGVSRSTYYRRRAARKAGRATVETDSRPIDRRSSIEKHQCHCTLGCTAEAALECGGAPSEFTAKPLSSHSSRVGQSPGQSRPDPIAGLDDKAFRALHLERYRILAKFPLSPAEDSRLADLDEKLATERERREVRRALIASLGGAGNPTFHSDFRSIQQKGSI
ncbi:hypothetical protein KUL72_06890 [Bradyrhizobium arachidis]|uniref:hypothetical protein n=1 Tax=Bradyrhizobium arachidis TaxID=858423 RepID=UPI0021631BC9|nr:hypothetical protein [Bradyrhizobium arachidis]UVO38097.1 hypothetical protein KUL72_06890 [Bradyrhizobium arachidis]